MTDADNVLRSVAGEEWDTYSEFKAHVKPLDDPIQEVFEIYADALIARLVAAVEERDKVIAQAIYLLEESRPHEAMRHLKDYPATDYGKTLA